jgi:hypothetical protein
LGVRSKPIYSPPKREKDFLKIFLSSRTAQSRKDIKIVEGDDYY